MVRADRPPMSEYQSYQYLGERDRAAFHFDFPPEIGRVRSARPHVDPAQEELVQQMLDEHPVISLHSHPTRRPLDPSQGTAYRRSGRDVTGYAGLSVSGMDAFFDNMMDGSTMIVSRGGWTWNDVVFDMGMRQCDFAHQDLVTVAHTVRDIHQAKRDGQIGAVLTLESLTCIESEIDRLEVLYGLGLRSAGLVYSNSNQLGSGLAEQFDGGLTTLGRRAIQRMNDIGMLVDVAHASDRTCLQAIEHSRVPVTISHRGARALWPTPRMAPDNVIRACAERGGVIGIEAAPHTTVTRNHPRHCLDSVMEHFEYCADLVGLDHVAFGPDTNFGDHAGWHVTFSHVFMDDERSAPPHERVAYVDGIENPSEEFPNIVRWLVGHGYAQDDIVKVIGGNILRLLGAVWTGASGA
jgi:membrane dipeptidase